MTRTESKTAIKELTQTLTEADIKKIFGKVVGNLQKAAFLSQEEHEAIFGKRDKGKSAPAVFGEFSETISRKKLRQIFGSEICLKRGRKKRNLSEKEHKKIFGGHVPYKKG